MRLSSYATPFVRVVADCESTLFRGSGIFSFKKEKGKFGNGLQITKMGVYGYIQI